MSIKSFNTIEEMFAALDANRQAADNASDDYQKTLAIGDFFIREAQGIFIYGEILDPSKPEHPTRHDGRAWTEDELEEYAEDGKLYNAPHMKNYRFTRSYSPLCADGELGDVHVATVSQKLSQEQFEAARAAGWPQDVAEVRALLNVQPGEEV